MCKQSLLFKIHVMNYLIKQKSPCNVFIMFTFSLNHLFPAERQNSQEMQMRTWKCWAEGKGCHLDFLHLIWDVHFFTLWWHIFICGPWWFLCLPLTRLSHSQLIGAHLVLKQEVLHYTHFYLNLHLSLWFETSHVFWSINACTQLELYRAWTYDPSILFCKLLEMSCDPCETLNPQGCCRSAAHLSTN